MKSEGRRGVNASTYRERYPQTFKARAASRAARKEYEEAKESHERDLRMVRWYLDAVDGKRGDPLMRDEHRWESLEGLARGAFNFGSLSFGKKDSPPWYSVGKHRAARWAALAAWRPLRRTWKEVAKNEGAPYPRDLGTRYPDLRTIADVETGIIAAGGKPT